MKKKNIAIIGLGYWGTIVTNTLVSMGFFNKVFIYDNDPNKVKIIRKKFGRKVTSIKIAEIKKKQ